VGCTERPRSHVFSVELFAGVPGGLAGYLAAYRVEFRGQPGRSCGPWWRSSCRLWPRPSTWSRAGCLVDGTITPCWSCAEHDELWSRARHHRVQRPTGSTCSTAPPSTSPTRCRDAPAMRKAFATTPVAEIVAHSGDGFVDKGAEASAMAKRLIVCCDGTWNTLNESCLRRPMPDRR
jgi:hypothetical protein